MCDEKEVESIEHFPVYNLIYWLHIERVYLCILHLYDYFDRRRSLTVVNSYREKISDVEGFVSLYYDNICSREKLVIITKIFFEILTLRLCCVSLLPSVTSSICIWYSVAHQYSAYTAHQYVYTT